MPFGGLSPIRALLAAAAACSMGLALIVTAAGLLDGPGTLLFALDQLKPSAVLGRFGPALCLVPLAARLRTPWIAVAYLGLGSAMPILAFWGSHPYDIGIVPPAAAMSLGHWTSGIPAIVFGAFLAIMAARSRDRLGLKATAPYRAFASSLVALALIGVPAVYLLNGGDLRPWGLASLAMVLAGALKGSLLAGPVAGLAAYVLTRGLGRAAGWVAMVALGLLSSPMAGVAEFPIDAGPVWYAGFLSFAAALASEGASSRRSRDARPPLASAPAHAT